MGGALYRFEAVETDAAVDTLPFSLDNPRTARFRFQHAAVGTVFDTFPSRFHLYSRYNFLLVFTALQILFGLFTLMLFNYLSHIRYHYASGYDSNATLVHHPHKLIAPVYLGVVCLGLFFIIFVVLYIMWVNSELCMEWELQRWLRDKRSRPTTSALHAAFPDGTHPRHRNETVACRLRRLGVRWISGRRPYYAFPSRYLADFDYRHDLHVRYGSRATRRNPQTAIFFCMWPFVLAVVVLDLLTIDELRTLRRTVPILEGLVVGLGFVYLLYVARYIVTKALMCGRTCLLDLKDTFHL